MSGEKDHLGPGVNPHSQHPKKTAKRKTQVIQCSDIANLAFLLGFAFLDGLAASNKQQNSRWCFPPQPQLLARHAGMAAAVGPPRLEGTGVKFQ